MCRSVLLLAIVLLLSGCGVTSTLGKMAKVAMNPDIQVGSDKSQPSQADFSLVAEPDINASDAVNNHEEDDDDDDTDTAGNSNITDDSDENSGTPVNLQIVMLAEDSRFLATDYDQVNSDLKKALGKNYLDHQDYTLLPGQFKYLPPVKLDSDVRYIGVIAGYADPDAAQWRKVIKVKSTGQTYHILVHLYADNVELQLEE